MIETAAVLKSGAPVVIKEVYKASSNFLTGIKDEAKQIFSDELSTYLYKYETDFKLIKTILHRHEPVPFYDIYFPAKLLYSERAKESADNTLNLEAFIKILDTESANRIFWHSRFITITGEAGSGKSTLIKHIFLNCIAEKFGIPILIQLRDLNENFTDISVYIKEKIVNHKIAQNQDILNRLLNAGKFVFLLDGYDEIQAKYKNKIILSVNNFVETYSDNRFLITTRPFSNLELLPKFHNYRIKDLSQSDVVLFIDKQKINSAISDKIKKSLAVSNHKYLINYLKNPLLLTLYIVTYSANSNIPDSKSVFYRRVFETLYREHDSASKIGFEREFSSQLYQEQFEQILETFSLITFFDSKYSFDKNYLNKQLNVVKKLLNEKNKSFPNFEINKVIIDLKTAIGIWTEDSGIISFAHRSMQEYFAASCIQNANSNKEAIYSKLLSRLDAHTNSVHPTYGSDIENFLSLCKELDKYNYIKYIEVPAIKESINAIKVNTLKNKLLMTLTIFIPALIFLDRLLDETAVDKAFPMVGYVTPAYKYQLFNDNFIDNLQIIFHENKFIQTKEFLSLLEESGDEFMPDTKTLNIEKMNKPTFDWLSVEAKKKISQLFKDQLTVLTKLLKERERILKDIEKNEIDIANYI